MFAACDIAPSTPLFAIPGKALLNMLTLEGHYPETDPALSGTQIVALHLFLHRPSPGHSASGEGDPLFGPFIAVLPKGFDTHPLTWLLKRNKASLEEGAAEIGLLSHLPPFVAKDLERVYKGFVSDWERVSLYLVGELFALPMLSFGR